jgi:hypothetical protein
MLLFGVDMSHFGFDGNVKYVFSVIILSLRRREALRIYVIPPTASTAGETLTGILIVSPGLTVRLPAGKVISLQSSGPENVRVPVTGAAELFWILRTLK